MPLLNPAPTVQPLVTKSPPATKDITFLLTKNPAPKTTPAKEIPTQHAMKQTFLPLNAQLLPPAKNVQQVLLSVTKFYNVTAQISSV